jgi:hypothetical protein
MNLPFTGRPPLGLGNDNYKGKFAE